LPILGLIPILGRLFTAPTRNNNKTDIVIAVTPRVLRAPAVTPRDEELRPSGTLQTPTSGSLEAMVQEAEREEQLAAARTAPANVVAQVPAAEQQPAYVPASQSSLPANTTAAAALPAQPSTQTGNALTTTAGLTAPAQSSAPPASLNVAAAVAQLVGGRSANTSTNNAGAATPQLLNLTDTPPQQTTIATTTQQPTDAATVAAQETTAPPPSYARPATTIEKPSAAEKVASGVNAAKAQATPTVKAVAELRLMPAQAEMRVGEKQRLALMLISSASLNAVMVKLRFDSRFVAVRGISQGDLSASAPVVMQSIDPSGIVTVSLMPPAGGKFKTGASVLVFLDIEAVATGESALSFEKNSVQLSSANSQLTPQLFESRIVVK
jgi:hypothetical protein